MASTTSAVGAADHPRGEVPSCAHCDTAMKPERIGAGRYICPVCSRVTILPK